MTRRTDLKTTSAALREYHWQMDASKPRYRRSSVLARLLEKLKTLFHKPGSDEDPYAYVGAPKKPKLPQRSAAAVLELPND